MTIPAFRQAAIFSRSVVSAADGGERSRRKMADCYFIPAEAMPVVM
jgi:hypothetical protein